MTPLYFSRLDILRFVAFFLVFWQHGFAGAFAAMGFQDKELLSSFTMTGGYGVHIFFVLSGFLITLLLLKEQQFNDRISLKNFYIRRTLRIWPLYYLVMLTGIFILPAVFDTIQFCGNPFLSLFFLNNYDVHIECTTTVGMTWSVAIEEQFYLIWPLLFILLIRKPKILFLCCVLLFGCSAYYNFVFPSASYFGTFGNVVYLMAGCMGAILFEKRSDLLKNTKWMNRTMFYTLIVVLLVLIAFKFPFKPLVFPFIYLYAVIYLVVREDHSKRINIFSRLGKYTYGMYMYHPALIVLFKIMYDKLGFDYLGNGTVYISLALVALLTTILVSWVSYELFEKRILKFKSRFASIKTRV